MAPILFEFGIITVFSLWLFIAVGFVAGSYLFVKLAKRNRIKIEIITDHSVGLFLWTLAWSRIVFILTNLDLFHSIKTIFMFWDKGFSFWGALFALFSGMWYLTRRTGSLTTTLRVWDILAPALSIGMLFGNIGAFLAGKNYGSPTDLPWGIAFTNSNVKYITAIHPTQLYSAIYCLGIGILLIIIVEKLRDRLPGLVAETGLTLFSLFKFLEEFVRGDDTIKLSILRIPQVMAFFGLIAGLYLLYRRYRNTAGSDPQRILKNAVDRIISKVRRKPNLEISAALQNQTV